MTAEQTRHAQPGVDPAPPFMRVIRIAGGNLIEGPWHAIEPAGWAAGVVRVNCGVRGRSDSYRTATELPAGARLCPRCPDLRKERGK